MIPLGFEPRTDRLLYNCSTNRAPVSFFVHGFLKKKGKRKCTCEQKTSCQYQKELALFPKDTDERSEVVDDDEDEDGVGGLDDVVVEVVVVVVFRVKEGEI